MKADIIFYNGYIYNTPFKKFFKGYFSVKEDKILHLGIGEIPQDIQYDQKFDLKGQWVIPGLIDSHMHVESSMLSPRPFAKLLAENAVTTVVSEPHEIANVTGLEGVIAMIEAAKGAEIDIFYAIPSSVPSTSQDFETTGDVIDLVHLQQLMNYKEVVCLGEVMNTYKILNDPQDKQNLFVKYLKENYPAFPLEGHCPRIVGSQLNQYVYTGIESDHTEHTLQAFYERVFNGMIFQVQRKMAKPEIAKIIIENDLYENIAVVTDDVTPNELINHGHLNHVVMQLVNCGIPFEKAIYCASAVPAKRMRLYDRGQIMPGKKADFCILDTVSEIKPIATYKNGKKVFDKQNPFVFNHLEKAFPTHFYETMKNNPVCTTDFIIQSEKNSVKVNALSVDRHSTKTELHQITLPVVNNIVQLTPQTNKIFVLERHGKNHNIGKGFAIGDCVIEGAVATSYAHDHHNLLVLGNNDEDMALAANTVSKLNGGIVVVKSGQVLAQCQLEVCGLMSERNPYSVSKEIEEVETAMRNIGYIHYNPIMSLATTCLPVSMDVKITDKGLIDVQNGKIIPVII